MPEVEPPSIGPPNIGIDTTGIQGTLDQVIRTFQNIMDWLSKDGWVFIAFIVFIILFYFLIKEWSSHGRV